MKKYRLFILAILFACIFLAINLANAADGPIRVAVIDSGYDYESKWPDIGTTKNDEGILIKIPKLCKEGHTDFTGTGLQDTHGHGTHVAGIIGTYADRLDYCLVILKNYDPKSDRSPLGMTIDAIKKAIELKVDIINYSGGGKEFSLEEYNAVQDALNKGIIFVTAAGNHKNEKEDGPRKIDEVINNIVASHIMDKKGVPMYRIDATYINNITLITSKKLRLGYYPANYDKRIIAVQNMDKDGQIAKTSRYGAAYSYKAMGVDVLSLGLDNKYEYASGTSQASAKITAQIIKGFAKK